MGTSSSYGGPGGNTPLVPTWLNSTPPSLIDTNQSAADEQPSPPVDTISVGIDGNLGPNNTGIDQVVSPPEAPPGPPPVERFRQSRSNFTRYVKGGGRKLGILGKALSSYITTSSGGVQRAAQRMGSSRRATRNLVTFLGSVQSRGAEAALNSINLGELVGRPIEDIFLGLADFICPDGGSIDEGIARNAFIETIADLAEQGIQELEALTVEQLQTIVEIYASHTIEGRICNDIGTKIIVAPENISLLESIQKQLYDFIRRSVSDALGRFQDQFRHFAAVDSARFIDEIYVEAFTILHTLSEVESIRE